VQAARTLGVSTRRFEGWEPKQTTRVTEWTPDGRPAVWVTEPEPEWNRRERSLMLALALWEGQLCRKCHEHLEQATAAGQGDTALLHGKLAAARFFFRYELPKVPAWLKVVETRDDTCRSMNDAWF
jgi:hypothetical protein